MTTIADTTPAPSLERLVERRIPGRALEAPFYADDDVFDLDISAIFTRHWLFVASTAEIPEPGDYLTIDIGPYPILVIRDDDGDVRALHNVCRHRGSRVLSESSGSTGNLVCGYHQWTYATDGRLLHAGQQAADFDKTCYALKTVHCRVVGGLIFICLAADPPSDFDDVASRTLPYLAPHQLHRTKVAAQLDTVEDANWKLVMENNRECYHCEAGHPELMYTFFPTYGYAEDEIPPRLMPAHARYLQAQADLESACTERGMPYEEIEEIAGRPSAFRIQREPLDGAGESYTLDGSAACRKLLGDLDITRLGRLSLHHQPNSWFHFLADHAVTSMAIPLGPERTLVRTTWLVHEDAVEGRDYDADNLTAVWRRTNEQDAELVVRAQSGVKSPVYEPGPYAPNEYQVDSFCTWYIDETRKYLRS
ncbi:aromatic ring-hydroxylating oxygenase subunit alpha [Solicola gregarius]|uniref:Aromatic ring-hydroxylating dioxygenase subunit alpha n=1 Tax=Solicola gregarius TaxID=2908642 RepID=A0AA46TFI6_9ACTN|nr:aromatic ring-hydroxylating dioxygenase subunit alpha [Solicola gregarius]UYM04381.1 aromatic ring-hydroxylating dioxygenase subunit alpha [Solicola gregarius]